MAKYLIKLFVLGCDDNQGRDGRGRTRAREKTGEGRDGRGTKYLIELYLSSLGAVIIRKDMDQERFCRERFHIIPCVALLGYDSLEHNHTCTVVRLEENITIQWR